MGTIASQLGAYCSTVGVLGDAGVERVRRARARPRSSPLHGVHLKRLVYLA